MEIGEVVSYRRGDELADSAINVLEALLRILELGKHGGQECLRAIDIMLRRIMAIHAMFMVRVALDIEDMPLYTEMSVGQITNRGRKQNILRPKDHTQIHAVSWLVLQNSSAS